MEPTQQEIIESLKYKLDNEGFEYAVRHYSDWKELEDETFHELRQNYIDATKRLEEYIETL